MSSPVERRFQIDLSRRQVRWFYGALWLINGLLFFSNILLAAGWEPPMRSLGTQLNMDKEAVIGSWYPSILLFMLALFATLLYARDSDTCQREERITRFGWLVLAGLALALSADEVAGFHETLSQTFRAEVRSHIFGLRVNWTLLLFPFILASVVFLLWSATRMLSRVRYAGKLALAGMVCWMGSLALEIVERVILFEHDIAGRAFLPPIEETSELIGTTLFLMSLFEFGFFSIDKTQSGVQP